MEIDGFWMNFGRILDGLWMDIAWLFDDFGWMFDGFFAL